MNELTQLVPLTKKSLKVYTQAVRRLRRDLGDRAPSLRELVEHEIFGREGRVIADAYLDLLHATMGHSPCIHFTVPLPAADYHVFVSATRILRRVMGRKAPTTLGLIQRNLTERTPNGVADDYLEWVGWPQGRLSTRITRPKPGGGRGVRMPGTRLKTPVLRPNPLLDPTRN